MTYLQIQHLFPQLSEIALCNAIVENGSLAHFSAEEIIMDYGNNLKFLPLITKGGLRVLRKNENGEEVFLYFLNAGETCAMSLSCFKKNNSQVKVIAEKDTSLLMIPISKIEDWMRKFPSWNHFVTNTYHTCFNEMLKTIDSIAFNQLDSRLLNYLEKKSSFSKKKSLELTHQDIATELNSSREAISRLLKKLENNKQIELRRNRIILVKGFSQS